MNNKLKYIFLIPLMALLCCADMWADEVMSDTAATVADSLVQYRHPLPIRLEMHVPRKAVLADACPVDSVIGTDRNGNLLTQKYYEYDAAGHMVAEINYSWNGGVRTGVSRYKKIYTGSTVTATVNYQWDAANHKWIGMDSTQMLFYSSGYLSSSTKFIWKNNAWERYDCYSYEYLNNTDKRTKSLYTKWNSEARQDEGVDMYEWVYDENSGKTLLSAYWGFTNNQPVGKTKTVYQYNAAGSTVLEEKYKGWENGDWKGSEKTTYEYNAKQKVTDKIIYNWSSGWKCLKRTTQDYDASNRVIDQANYKWANNKWQGTSRTSTEYISSTETAVVSWLWVTSEWVKNQRTYKQTQSGKVVKQIVQKWDGDDWINFSLLQNTYTSNNLTLSYTAAWTGTDWRDSLQTICQYEKGTLVLQINAKSNGVQWFGVDSMKRDLAYTTIAGKTVLVSDSTMYWSATSNKWIGEAKTTKEYDDNGNEIIVDTYTYSGNRWIHSEHKETNYKDNNSSLPTSSMTMVWDNKSQKWDAKGPKMEYEYDETNRCIGSATYRWDISTSSWLGVSRSYEEYAASLLKTKYVYQWNTAAKTWVYSLRIDYEYNAQNLSVSMTESAYNNLSASWIYSERELYEYSTKGTLIGTTKEVWNDGWYKVFQNEESYDDSESGGRLRYELTANYTNCEVSYYVKNNYYYACDPRYYTIRFVNYDGAELSSSKLKEGSTPNYSGEAPIKEATAQYTFTFDGWDKTVTAVTGDAIYKATFSQTVNKYKVTFVNEDGSPIEAKEWDYGTMPVAPSDPAKEATAQYTYAFEGWDKTVTAVTGETSYKATFTQTVNKYKVTFAHEDGSTIEAKEWDYGTMPVAPLDPAKDATAQYNYTFDGWDKTVTAVIGEATYKATFTQMLNKYKVTFANEDGSPIEAKEWEYGTMPVAPSDPSKDATAQYNYTFDGWDNEPVAVTGEATYKATFRSTLRQYAITWLNEDGSQIDQTTVAYGVVPTHADASKEKNAQYTYAFAGWDNTPVAVTGEATYKATFTQTVNKYKVTFAHEDGSTIEAKEWEYGATPVAPADPTKAANAVYTYAFAGWDKEITDVTGETTYKAVFTKLEYGYTVTFMCEGRIIQSSQVKTGTVPEYKGETPAKDGTAAYYYRFTGWDKKPVAVTENAVYTAEFEKVMNEYTIIWVNDDDTELDRATYEYGQMPATEVVPSKSDDTKYTYTFAGWDKTMVAATADATYKATYSKTVKVPTDLDNVQGANDQCTKIMIDGRIYILRGGKTYTLDGTLVK